MKNYPWLFDQYKDIIKKYLRKKLHPIILIQSNNDIGVSQLILNIYQWILCHDKKKYKICRICLSCRLNKQDNHPDVYNLYSLSKKKIIGINIIRDMINSIHHTAQQGGSKIVYCPEMNKLTQEANHAVLKTLEEPPKNTIFFLYTNNILHLNPTIISRSTIYLINTPSEKKNLIWLKKKNKIHTVIQLLTALRINNNAPISAHKFLNSPIYQQRNLFIQSIYQYIYNRKNTNLLQNIYDVNKKNIIKWICDLLIDCIKYKICHVYKIRNLDQLKIIKIISKKNNVKSLQNNLQSWIRYQKILLNAFNIDKNLIFIEQMLSWTKLLS